MASKLKPRHGFRVGDIVTPIKGRKIRYVVCGTQGWIHSTWKNDDGTIDSWISIAQEIGATSLLTHASEYKLVMKREDVPKKWWTVFVKGEK